MTDAKDSKHQRETVSEPVAGQLVTVESQSEHDLFTGQRTERTFLKLYVAARTSGLLAAISDRDWKTLCTLATYMDANGYCFPSQTELARALGCSRQMANERVKHLAQFRFQDRPVLLVEKEKRSQQGRWTRNGYRVLPIASLGIFKRVWDVAGEPADRRKSTRPKWTLARDHAPGKGPRGTVSRSLDTAENRATVSSGTVTVGLDTNQNQPINQISLSSIRKAHQKETEVPSGEKRAATTKAGPHAPRPPASASLELVAETLGRRRPLARAQTTADEREVILSYMHDFAREFHDRAPLTSTTTRALNLYHRSGIALATYVGYLFRARSVTRERSAGIRDGQSQAPDGSQARNKTAYFFAVLEDLLGFKESSGPTHRERNETRR